MNVEAVSLPEVILKEESDHFHSGHLHFFTPCHQAFTSGRSVLQEMHIHQLSDRSPGQLCPSTSHHATLYKPASLTASTVATKLNLIESTEQSSDTLIWTNSTQHPSLQQMIGSPQTQVQTPFGLNILPSVCPPPLSLQALSPNTMVQPEFKLILPQLVLSPFSPQNSCWHDITPVASTPESRCSFSPCKVDPCSPLVSPPSLLLLPEVCPSWCMCPQAVLSCQTGRLSMEAAEPVSKVTNVTPKVKSEAKSRLSINGEGDKLQNDNTPDKDKLQANETDNNTMKFRASPEPAPNLVEETLAERAFEDYMMIMDSLFPVTQETYTVNNSGNERDEGEGDKKLETGNGSFLEYLDKLCSDEDFVRTVGMTLNTDYLDSRLSSDPEPLDLLALDKQDQQTLEMIVEEHLNPQCVDSNNEPVWLTQLFDAFFSSERQFTDDFSLKVPKQASEQSGQSSLGFNSNSDTQEMSLTSDVKLRAPSSILDPVSTQSDPNPNHDGQNPAPKAMNMGLKEHGSSCSPLQPSVLLESAVSGPHNDPPAVARKDPANNVRADLQSDSSIQLVGPPATSVLDRKPSQVRELDKQCRSKNIHPECSCPEDKSHSFKNNHGCAVHVQASSFGADSYPSSCDPQVDDHSLGLIPDKEQLVFSVSSELRAGGREIQKLKSGEECVASNTQEKQLVINREGETQQIHKTRVKCKNEGIQMPRFTRRARSLTSAEEVQMTSSRARGKIQHTGTETKVIKSPSNRTILDKQVENVNTHSQAISSPQKKSKSRRDKGSERANKADEDFPEDKVSENCGPPTQSESPLQRSRVQTDTHSTNDTRTGDQGSQKAVSQERNESKHPISNLPSCETNPKAAPIECPESIRLSQEQRKRATHSEDRTGRHNKAKTWHCYSLRSQNGSKDVVGSTEIHENKESETLPQVSSPKPGSDQTAVKGERTYERYTSPKLSPMKRYLQQQRDPKESETRGNETGKVGTKTQSLSPTKKARMKSNGKTNSRYIH